MGWLLKKLLGSDQNMKGPDLSNAPWLELDFSGNRLRYRDPMHTAMFPVSVFAENKDIYDVHQYERQKEGDLAELFYIKGWEFSGRANSGEVRTSGRIFYFDNKLGGSYNCFEKPIFEHEIFEFCHIVWGWQNESTELGDLGKKLFLYPIDSTGLDYQDINKTRWCRFTAQVKGKPPEIHYACPLTSHHMLMMDFTLTGYGGTDFYSPETNLEQATLKYVENFMANFYIELSDEAKAQQAAAKNPL